MIRSEEDINISVIMTVKNGEKFLRCSLMSVLNQSLKPKELIVVDDGSDDSTWSLLESIAQEHALVRPIRTNGLGRSKALNMALSNTIGSWVANIDADDIWHKDKLRLQANTLKNNPDAVLVATGTEIFYNNDSPKFLDENVILEDDKFAVKFIEASDFVKTNPINHSSALFNKNSVMGIGGYNEKLKKLVDIDLWFRLKERAHDFLLISHKLTGKRIHSEQNFEAKTNFSLRADYSYNLFKMNIKFIMKNRMGLYSLIIVMARYLYHLLPRGLKSTLREKVSK